MDLKKHFKDTEALTLESFKEMDFLAVEKFNLPIELMMENAGLQLAHLVVKFASANSKIYVGAGNGNNGGGGLVAARRLAGWGYSVFLDLPVEITKELPKRQLDRALLFGAREAQLDSPDIWVDAYLGFSQRLPLAKEFTRAIQRANASKTLRISLDLPIGISASAHEPQFLAHQVLTLAAPKKILNVLPEETEIFIADLGIPEKIYQHYNIPMPEFFRHQIT